MKVGIVVHSRTGNTLSVASKLEETLIKAGHAAKIERVTALNDPAKDAKSVRLESVPDVSGYDVVIFGAPVHGFSLSLAMKAYLSQIVSLQGKKVGCFVTQQLPYKWLGGNRAVGQMKTACKGRGADVFATGVVNWSNKLREEQIVYVVEQLSKL